MSKTYRYTPEDQQAKQSGYSQSSKKAKLSKQQAGRMEKAMLRNCGSVEL